MRVAEGYRGGMSAREVIEQIKQLPGRERAEVARFVETFETTAKEQTVRYADRERAREISARIFDNRPELFRKLAE